MINYKKYERALQFLEVEENGDVYRKERTWVSGNRRVCYQPRQIAKTQINIGGYVLINVQFEGKEYRLLVHRLIATAFIPKPEGWDESWQVNHIDGNKQNNDVSNLEWCTASENIQHAYRIGLNNYQKPVQMLDKSTGEVIKKFCSAAEAERQTEIFSQSIGKCCLGKRKSAGGFGWRFTS